MSQLKFYNLVLRVLFLILKYMRVTYLEDTSYEFAKAQFAILNTEADGLIEGDLTDGIRETREGEGWTGS